MPDDKPAILVVQDTPTAALAVARADRRAWAAERELAKAQERTRLVNERLTQLESLVASSFARSVRTLSSSRGQLGRSIEADKVVKIVEDALEATRYLDALEVPGVTLLQRVKWLDSFSHRQVDADVTALDADFDFQGATVTAPGEDIVEVVERERAVPQLPPAPVSFALLRCKHKKTPGDGGFVDGCGWQGPHEQLVGLTGKGHGCCPACGSPHVRALPNL